MPDRENRRHAIGYGELLSVEQSNLRDRYPHVPTSVMISVIREATRLGWEEGLAAGSCACGSKDA